MKKAFGIIGNPIDHSLSPLLHNYWFKKYNVDASYSIIKCDEKNLGDVVKKIKNNSLNGINVTLPYKQKIINYVDKIINDAEATGSVNTLILDEDIVGCDSQRRGAWGGALELFDDWFCFAIK